MAATRSGDRADPGRAATRSGHLVGKVNQSGPHGCYWVMDQVNGIVAVRPWSALVAPVSSCTVNTYVADALDASGDMGAVKLVEAMSASVCAFDGAGHAPACVGKTQASVAPLVVLATVTSTSPQKPLVSCPT